MNETRQPYIQRKREYAGSNPYRQRGAVVVEYVLVTMVVLATLFVPLPALGMSLVEWVLEAIRNFQANSSYLMSLP